MSLLHVERYWLVLFYMRSKVHSTLTSGFEVPIWRPLHASESLCNILFNSHVLTAVFVHATLACMTQAR